MKIPVAILAATGAVGQRFISLLHNHPQFEIVKLVASDRSAGKSYAEATNWNITPEIPASVRTLRVESLDDFVANPTTVKVAFSGLPSGIAGPIELQLANAGIAVFTNAKDHRMDPKVPLLIPEVNAHDLRLIDSQSSSGYIVANGNCSAIILSLALAPLVPFGIQHVNVVTMQALSGAGYPGVASLDVVDNLIPFIANEEDKLEEEPPKMLGCELPITATCTRVPVRDGHTEVVHIEFKGPVKLTHIRTALESFRGPMEVARLHSAPKAPIFVTDLENRPQPRLDRDAGAGMSVVVGRLRQATSTSVQFVLLGHNTIRGAAGQSVLNAEYALAMGKIA